MSYIQGKEIIKQIKETRDEINFEDYHIRNAEFRISQISSIADKMWINIKKEHAEKLCNAEKKLKDLYEKLFSLKKACSTDEWNNLLQMLGTVIAQTENIPHVVNSLHDEFSLQRALNEVENIIKLKQEKLELAKSNNDEDSITFIKAQLKFHENDMKRHHWGVERFNNINEKKKSI